MGVIYLIARTMERDVKDFHNIRDEIAFYNFLGIAAARTGNLTLRKLWKRAP
jgi:hypothetical protein